LQRPRRATKGLGDRPWGRFAPTLCPHSVAGPTLPTPSLDRPQRRVRPPWAAARFACRRRDRRRPPKLPPGRRVLPSSHDEVSLRPFRTSPRPEIFADCFPQQKVFQDEALRGQRVLRRKDRMLLLDRRSRPRFGSDDFSNDSRVVLYSLRRGLP
jgi:hypothetical protein